MPSEEPSDSDVARPEQNPFDEGLLSPVTTGFDASVSDAAVLACLVTAEVALVRAWAVVDAAPRAVADDVSSAWGWVATGEPCRVDGLSTGELAAASRGGGNPVIPLVAMLRARVSGDDARGWVHRGATSQDILDSALMLMSRRAGEEIVAGLGTIERALADLAVAHRDETAAARTLTQHAVPTTVGLRAAGWLRGISRARARLNSVVAELPGQLGGAGGTLASFVEIGGADAATALPGAYAAELGLAVPDGLASPWHTGRWPVTELGDALVQAIDALGKIAADAATLSRTEIGELSEGSTGGSSAMPQKQNPAASVLIRSAALRAPHLGATLHTASAFAVDERPDGAWHAEWPTLRELLRLALGATGTAAGLVDGLQVDASAVARNLALTDGLIVAERLSIRLVPVIGKAAVSDIVARASAGESLAALVQDALASAGSDLAAGALLDPAEYTGLAGSLVDDAVADVNAEEDDS